MKAFTDLAAEGLVLQMWPWGWYSEVDKGDIASPSHPTVHVSPAPQVFHLWPETGSKKYSA